MPIDSLRQIAQGVFSVLDQLYKVAYRRWNQPRAALQPGYSLWLMLPGDMPFFFDLFLGVFANKQVENLVETLIVPDRETPGLRDRIADFAAAWPHGPVRTVGFPPLERFLSKTQTNPHALCWMQFYRATRETRSTHALWHDADLFVFDPPFFDAHYRECIARQLDGIGLAPAWDRWYAEMGRSHVTSTWEMMYRMDWIREYAPWMHRGHLGEFQGSKHIFDITLLPQALSPPEKIGQASAVPDFVHFNYVICTYRNFQNATGSFEDDYFRILLLRLLINAYGSRSWKYDIPELADLKQGIQDRSRRVTYLATETATHYDEFRTKLNRLLHSPVLTAAQATRIAEEVGSFDHAFGWAEAAVGVAI